MIESSEKVDSSKIREAADRSKQQVFSKDSISGSSIATSELFVSFSKFQENKIASPDPSFAVYSLFSTM